MTRLLPFFPFVLCAGIFQSVVADEVCSADGVCFASEAEAHDYYSNGVLVPIDFGEDQSIAGADWKKTLENLEKSKKYMKEVVSGPEFDGVRKNCIIRNELCSFWAAVGTLVLQCVMDCGAFVCFGLASYFMSFVSSPGYQLNIEGECEVNPSYMKLQVS